MVVSIYIYIYIYSITLSLFLSVLLVNRTPYRGVYVRSLRQLRGGYLCVLAKRGLVVLVVLVGGW